VSFRSFSPPPNFLIFVPRRFPLRILRRRGCLWTPLQWSRLNRTHAQVEHCHKAAGSTNRFRYKWPRALLALATRTADEASVRLYTHDILFCAGFSYANIAKRRRRRLNSAAGAAAAGASCILSCHRQRKRSFRSILVHLNLQRSCRSAPASLTCHSV